MLIRNLAKLSRPPRIGRSLRVVTAVSAALLPSLASAAPWEINTLLEDDNYVSQKVELVDINADGFVDLVFANSKGNETGNQSDAQLNQVFINDGGNGFTADATVFLSPDNAYVIKAADIDNDGDPDLVVGVNFAGKSYALINDNGSFTDQVLGDGLNYSIGDLELGDVDGDGDLDIFAADWGMSQPYGDPDDQGGPMRLWLNDGDGNFSSGDAQLPMGMEALASWVFDVELVDFDNDYDLDAMISTRGFGKALMFRNDGAGNFENYPVPALQPAVGKNVNVAFTPMDFDGDDFVDVLTLQDGPGAGACVDIDGDQYCAKRNTVLINDKVGQFIDNPGAYWDLPVNPPKLDFDAATLDFDNDGAPDFVVTGLRLGGNDNNSRLILNDPVTKVFKAAAPPNDAALPIDPGLGKTFGIAFADFNHDRREDVAVAVRDSTAPNVVLFGGQDPAAGVPEDISPPNIGNHEMLADLLYFGQSVTFRGRAHDFKTPTQWHDFFYDPNIDDLNLIGDSPTNHKRRLPYMEFMFGLANPDDIKAVPDTDPKKYISPGVWEGEGLWRIAFEVPLSESIPDTLTWQFCAIDAAGNRACDGPFSVMVDINCHNGVVDLGEDCDDDNDPLCVECKNTCGDDVCTDPPENFENCPEDCDPPQICDNDGVCEPPENQENCPNDCLCGNDVCDPGEPETCPEDCMQDTDTGGICGDGTCDSPDETPENCPEDCACDNDGVCEPPLENAVNCPNDCPPDDTDTEPTESFTITDTATEVDTACADSATAGSACELDDDGCGCVTEPGDTRGIWASLLLLSVFGVRRSRKRS